MLEKARHTHIKEGKNAGLPKKKHLSYGDPEGRNRDERSNCPGRRGIRMTHKSRIVFQVLEKQDLGGEFSVCSRMGVPSGPKKVKECKKNAIREARYKEICDMIRPKAALPAARRTGRGLQGWLDEKA